MNRPILLAGWLALMDDFNEILRGIVLCILGVLAIWALYINLFNHHGDDRHVDE